MINLPHVLVARAERIMSKSSPTKEKDKENFKS